MPKPSRALRLLIATLFLGFAFSHASVFVPAYKEYQAEQAELRLPEPAFALGSGGISLGTNQPQRFLAHGHGEDQTIAQLHMFFFGASVPFEVISAAVVAIWPAWLASFAGSFFMALILLFNGGKAVTWLESRTEFYHPIPKLLGPKQGIDFLGGVTSLGAVLAFVLLVMALAQVHRASRATITFRRVPADTSTA